MDRLNKQLQNLTVLWALFIGWTLFVTGFWLPRNWGFYGTGDWDLTYSTFEVARISMAEYGIWPSYQPFLAFGSDLNANPQSVHASLFFIPVLLFGTFYGYKISILAAILIGLFGAFRLFRRAGADHVISAGSAMVFCGAAYFSRHIFEAGHSNFLYLYYLPFFVLSLWNLGMHPSFRQGLTALFLMVQPLAGGAPLVFIMFSGIALLMGAGMVWIQKKQAVILLYYLLILLASALLCSWKLLPMAEQWSSFPRLVQDNSGISPLLWLQAIGDFKTDTRTPHDWHEIAIGFPYILLLLGLYRLRSVPDFRKWLLLGIPFIWLGLGNTPAYINPWYLLHHGLPVFDGLRAPYRFGIITLFLCSLLFVLVEKYYNNKQLIYIILIASVLSQTLSYNAISGQLVYSKRLSENRVRYTTGIQPVVLKQASQENQYENLSSGHLILNAYEPQHLSPVSDSLETFVSGGSLLAFTPEHIRLRASDSTLKLCLRYSPYWQLKGQGLLTNSNGLLAVANASGIVELQYINPAFYRGLRISGISTLLLLLAWAYSASVRRKHH